MVTGAVGSRRHRQSQVASASSSLGPDGVATRHDRGERTPQLAYQHPEFHVEHALLADDDHRHGLWGGIPGLPVGLAQPPPDPVAINRSSEPTAHGEAGSPAAFGLAPEHKKRRSVDSFASVEE